MATFAFTDDVGSATLTNTFAATPGARLRNVQPDADDVGPRATALGTGLVYQFRFRTDYTAQLEFPYLKATDAAVAFRLKRHLLGGGSVVVTTDDAGLVAYTCTLKPGTVPTFALEDRLAGDYTFACAVRNTAAAPIVVNYW